MTLADAVARAAASVGAVSSTPRPDAEVLAMHALGLGRSELITRAREPLSVQQRERLERAVQRRSRGEPVAYIIGRREFWSLDLQVSPATLIPRAETELLVERALAHLPLDCTLTVADLGTGCGAIALAIARECPNARVFATDCSRAALAVAEANARRLGITNVEFRLGSWFAPLAGVEVNILVSNPPYIADNDPHLTQGDVQCEPRVALAAGTDGLAAIRQIAADAFTYLPPDGWLILEHGWNQAAAVTALLAQQGYAAIDGYQDLARNDRVIECRRP